jgi:small multidrug resistance pump
MSWFYLAAAILLEVAGTSAMKLSNGFTRLLPTVLMAVFYALCFTFLAQALKRIDVSVAYAIWSGLGTAVLAAIGVLWFQEPVSALKVGSLGLIILGVVGLNLSGVGH